jgi:hypothetical protein
MHDHAVRRRDQRAAEARIVGVLLAVACGLHRPVVRQPHRIDRERAAAVAVPAIGGAALQDDALARERKDQRRLLHISLDGDGNIGAVERPLVFRRFRTLDMNAHGIDAHRHRHRLAQPDEERPEHRGRRVAPVWQLRRERRVIGKRRKPIHVAERRSHYLAGFEQAHGHAGRL